MVRRAEIDVHASVASGLAWLVAKPTLAVGSLLALLLLAGCGQKGPLAPPPALQPAASAASASR
jgi:predicted small lipoprotein YifL